MKIFPSLIAKNQKELNERFNKVKNISNEFHLDVMDGRFVKNKSLQFNFKLPKTKKYSAHLMIKNHKSWIKKNLNKIDLVIIHIETVDHDELLDIIEITKKRKKKIGIAINPKTDIKKIIPYINKVNIILIMTVVPGKYGSKFQSSTINKIRKLRAFKSKSQIWVDGGINDKTISKVKRAGANSAAVGSFIMNSDNPKKSIKILKGKL